MARFIFSITYTVKEKYLDEYKETARALKNYLTMDRGKNYAVFEVRGKGNQFSEVYICASEEEYDRLDEDSDDVTDQLIDQIVTRFVEDRKIEYRTMIELD